MPGGVSTNNTDRARTGPLRRSPSVLAFVLLAATTLLSPRLAAQALIVGTGPAGVDRLASSEAHAWAIIEQPATVRTAHAQGRDDIRRALVLHLPPRGSVSVGKKTSVTSPPGRARLLWELREMPTACASWGRELAMVFAPSDSGGRLLRSVLTMRVEPFSNGSAWLVRSERRLASLPSLPGTGEMLAFGSSPWGWLALLDIPHDPHTQLQHPIDGAAAPSGSGASSSAQPTTDHTPGLHLLLLTGSGWQRVALPSDAPQGLSPAGWTIAGSASSVLLAHATPQRIHMWVARHPHDAASRPTAPTLASTAPAWRWDAAVIADVPADPKSSEAARLRARLLRIGDNPMLALLHEPGFVSLFAWTGERFWPIGTVDDIPLDVVPFALDGSGSIGLVWTQTVEPRTSFESVRIKPMIAEVDAGTAKTLYRGEFQTKGPIEPWELQATVLLLVALTLATLLIALRPPPAARAAHLPVGFIPADRFRRTLAGVIDMLVVSLAVEGLNAAAGLLGMEIPVERQLWAALAHLLLVALLGFFASTVSERLWGRTFGKLATRCEVVALSEDPSAAPARPTLAQSAMRNGVRWLCPPVAIFGLLSLRGEHRGDDLAQTRVVVRTSSVDHARSE